MKIRNSGAMIGYFFVPLASPKILPLGNPK